MRRIERCFNASHTNRSLSIKKMKWNCYCVHFLTPLFLSNLSALFLKFNKVVPRQEMISKFFSLELFISLNISSKNLKFRKLLESSLANNSHSIKLLSLLIMFLPHDRQICCKIYHSYCSRSCYTSKEVFRFA